MDWFLRSQFAAGEFDGAIEITSFTFMFGLSAAPGLPDAEGKLVVKFSGDDLVGCLRDELCFLGRKLSEILIYKCAGFLQDSERADELRRHGVASDVEVMERTLSLGAPVHVRGNFDFAHAVRFSAHGNLRFAGHRCPD